MIPKNHRDSIQMLVLRNLPMRRVINTASNMILLRHQRSRYSWINRTLKTSIKSKVLTYPTAKSISLTKRCWTRTRLLMWKIIPRRIKKSSSIRMLTMTMLIMRKKNKILKPWINNTLIKMMSLTCHQWLRPPNL